MGMWIIRALSGFMMVAGLVWFFPAAWDLYFRDQITAVDGWHRLMAACAFFGIAALASIYEKLDKIAEELQKANRKASSLDALKNPLSDRVQQLASDPAKKIEAIVAYREETGASLVEAKAAIEAFSNRIVPGK